MLARTSSGVASIVRACRGFLESPAQRSEGGARTSAAGLRIAQARSSRKGARERRGQQTRCACGVIIVTRTWPGHPEAVRVSLTFPRANDSPPRYPRRLE